MTRFYLDPKHLEKWMHQNAAEYTGDFIEGCLQDNFIVWTKNGVAAFYEHYQNAWSSDFYVEFERGAGDEVWTNWYLFENKVNLESA